MGVRFSLPAPTILFIFSGFARSGTHFPDTSGTKGYSAHPMYFQQVQDLWHLLLASNLYIVSLVDAQLRSAKRTIGPLEKHFIRRLD